MQIPPQQKHTRAGAGPADLPRNKSALSAKRGHATIRRDDARECCVGQDFRLLRQTSGGCCGCSLLDSSALTARTWSCWCLQGGRKRGTRTEGGREAIASLSINLPPLYQKPGAPATIPKLARPSGSGLHHDPAALPLPTDASPLSALDSLALEMAPVTRRSKENPRLPPEDPPLQIGGTFTTAVWR